MTKLEPDNRGIDFLIGFLPSAIVVVATVAWLLFMESGAPLLAGGVGLVVAAIAALICRRPFIALGIAAVVLAAPLLVGSCFFVMAGIGS